MTRTLIVGDVHGCLQELDQLLATVEYRRGDDQLVFVGDLVDRGPDSAGVVRRARELDAVCVLGNHEWKHLRYRKQKAEGQIRVQFNENKIAINESISDHLWDWIASWPLFHRLHATLVVVHAGLQRGVAVEHQEERSLLMMRYAKRDTGKIAGMKLKGNEMLRPATAAFWTELWTGPESVVYGHHIVGFQPAVDEPVPGVKCYGIDTGCYTGKALTCAVFKDGLAEPEFVSVSAQGIHGVQFKDGVIEEDE